MFCIFFVFFCEFDAAENYSPFIDIGSSSCFSSFSSQAGASCCCSAAPTTRGKNAPGAGAGGWGMVEGEKLHSLGGVRGPVAGEDKWFFEKRGQSYEKGKNSFERVKERERKN